MKTSAIAGPLFKEALSALESGNLRVLKTLLYEHPELVQQRVPNPDGGYFKDPYLLWFVADNPIRNGKLPPNIVALTSVIVEVIKRQNEPAVSLQLDYALGLVATGRIPKECGVQITLMNLLIDEGARPANVLGALAQGNIAAAELLLARGGKLTLAAAVGLNRMQDVKRMVLYSGKSEMLLALTAAAFGGKTDMISFLLNIGAKPNGYPKNDEGFHAHATPLHQAVSSGSLDAVKLLITAGAELNAEDLIFKSTPLGWAEHLQADAGTDAERKKKLEEIASFLRHIV